VVVLQGDKKDYYPGCGQKSGFSQSFKSFFGIPVS